ncbi:MAG TPA: PRC-barrel domain-containing protein [Verrucomicrobiae bacterium]
MKRNLQTILCASAATVIAISAQAQQNKERQTDRSTSTSEVTIKADKAEKRAAQLTGAAKASDLVGMTVKNLQDEKIGKVEELGVDVESGRVLQVIVSTGGFAGIGDTLTAVPPSAFRQNTADKTLILDATKEQLKSAPKFDMSKWDEAYTADRLHTVYRHYGKESSLDYLEDNKIARNDSPNTVIKRLPDGTWDKERIEGDLKTSNNTIPNARLVNTHRASKVIGMPVKNLQDEKLGDVDNLLVDIHSGRIVAVAISSGGFIGLGDELTAVPSSVLSFNAEKKALQLDATKEVLARAPHFKSNQWPDFGDRTYVETVYRPFNVEPYFSDNSWSSRTERAIDRTAQRTERAIDRTVERTEQAVERKMDRTERGIVDADNTARNERDRDGRTLTPIEQGTSKADIDTTARIRKELVGNKNISLSAQNVKVISNNGKVTLRGPVETDAEKRIVGDIANRVARAENVDNQIEVKLVPTGRSQDGRPPQK